MRFILADYADLGMVWKMREMFSLIMLFFSIEWGKMERTRVR